MGLYKLKAGGHTEGSGVNCRAYSAKSDRNVVESELDLAADDPEKWDYYRGPRPAYLPPPGPTALAAEDAEIAELERKLAEKKASKSSSPSRATPVAGTVNTPQPTSPQPSTPAPPKPVGQQPAAQSTSAALESLTREQLVGLAEEREIEVKPGTSKTQLIELLKSK